ncbi:MAG TPA: methylmalonyl-CoA epimerase [Roseiflexaceae bacterium]|nr:methylmalonyl-CoA epimerase [Roseiflexaceae bacterium]HMP42779.1 methylmalonyl-CoA epimerase [Roseiflexaceae bacterium]
MLFTQVDHIGLAVRDLDEAVELYRSSFAITDWERIELPERHMIAAVARVGTTLIELIAPTSEAAAFAKFLNERGPGIHHIAYRVDDIVAALAELKMRGVRLIDETPRPGLHATLVAFLHPRSTFGTLVELVEHRSDT